ncbi:putative guanyl-nucleotide exchange factor [Phaeomoniella chlamydospora]|uniref:Putative guanyl-nucleotide exchange factor n=1 Tax=Phaeomoniella chlamydospora TaxID=158046 RepID=A0A0G2EZV1_PHACM|nr:putative guanyl-nucleotide exchange factor [Phaeomoniella chlamydospora]
MSEHIATPADSVQEPDQDGQHPTEDNGNDEGHSPLKADKMKLENSPNRREIIIEEQGRTNTKTGGEVEEEGDQPNPEEHSSVNDTGNSQALQEDVLPEEKGVEHGALPGEDAFAAQPQPGISVDNTRIQQAVQPTQDDAESIASGRLRSDSRSTQFSRTTPVSSTVFVRTALETIEASRDARRSKELNDSVQAALVNINDAQQAVDPEVIFRPLQLATRTYSVPLQVTALDCIGKLISYSYFAFPSRRLSASVEPQLPLIERAIETICDCFENEATPVEVQQQIAKSLLAAVLNDKIVVHGAGLLKAVRQIYNIFLYSKSSQNQQIAQGSLTQMIGTVFERVKVRLEARELRMKGINGTIKEEDSPADSNLALTQMDANSRDGDSELPEVQVSPPSDLPVPKDAQEKLTLQDFENSKGLDDSMVTDNAPTTVTRARPGRKATPSAAGHTPKPSAQFDQENLEVQTEEDEDEVYIKDAFLVVRSLCKLSQKVLTHEQQQDIKSQNMRSKILSLHLIHHVINNFTTVFTSPYCTIKSGTTGEPTPFTQVAKSHLCLSLSRNASSSVPKVFEVCTEIFWLGLIHLRVMLKKELEVFLKEIYLAVLERRNAPLFQKEYCMDMLERLGADARALVEIYLNYDCDRTALDNMYQRIIEHLARISSTPVAVTSAQQQQYQEQHTRFGTHGGEWRQRGTLPPSLTTATIGHPPPAPPQIPADYIMKQQSLETLIEILRSLDNWSSSGSADSSYHARYLTSRSSFEESRESLDNPVPSSSSPRVSSLGGVTGVSTPIAEDDPNEIEKVKQRKTALNEAIRQFNFKPKRGIKMLISEGFIKSDSADDIAAFLLRNDRLDKALIGEYLGEGEPENIAIMHAFVDQMQFSKRRFVDALRQFLQSFRLPGEAQKIDRFMLKFAERYLAGNPNAFANADTAYILAYSVILLNTDQHSSKFKGRRMSKEDFIKNNRGINDGQDLPDEYLVGIFEEIANHEIVLNTEREHAAALGIVTQTGPSGLASRAGQALANVGRDLQKEKYAQASEEMANKTEQLYKSLIRAQKRSTVREALSRFIPATSIKHVGSMFNVTWMSFLSGFSSQIQDTQNLEIIKECLEGIRLAIRISCRFDLETPRVAFVTALAKFTNLGNLKEMMAKNLEALKVLLDVAVTEGNGLQSSWREILTCVSQLDRFQLLSGGVDEDSLPDVTRARVSSSSLEPGLGRRQSARRPRPKPAGPSASYRADVALETKSTDMVRVVDRIFTNTANLSSEAIVDFIKALSYVSWQEIQSSGNSDSPRTYSLQKLVEISYYNMTRVRIEWTRIWEVLGEHFNVVGCHHNTVIVFFALDSLRQLSMRFMEIEELPGFKFQKDFLKPFEHIMANSSDVTVKDMILRCLVQMIQARGDNIRSGWKTMFGVFTVAAREPYEGIVNLAFDYTTQIYNTRFGVVVTQGAFADLVVCLTEFSKNLKFQKKSLQAIETLKSTVPRMLKTPECPLSWRHMKKEDRRLSEAATLPKQPTAQTQEEQFWYPVLIAYQDVLMTGDDLEVRSRALTYLFETLIKYGGDFPIDFWDVLWRQLLYPIFVVLQSKSEMAKAPNQEELSVWLSTTMVQALRNMITLFTHYFGSLERMLDRFLDLLALCICQENDTIARIGSNCLQQLILQNVFKFQSEHWAKIVGAFVDLFNRTTAYDLFSAAATMSHNRPVSDGESNESTGLALATPSSEPPTKANGVATLGTLSNGIADNASVTTETVDAAAAADAPQPNGLEDYRPHPDMQQQAPVVTVARRRFFNKIITNCVLQLLMIETVNELFSNDSVYTQIPSAELLRLMGLLKKSYQFAKKFNADKDLRMALWRQGFMKQPPNLLKQESGSAATYVSILVRMYHDEGEERKASRAETESALIPLCADIIRSYVLLDEETQQRNIVAWRPVVVDVMEGLSTFPEEAFDKHIETFYPLAIELLSREVGTEIRLALQGLLRRVGEIRLGMTPAAPATPTPTSPAQSFVWGRRGSKQR